MCYGPLAVTVIYLPYAKRYCYGRMLIPDFFPCNHCKRHTQREWPLGHSAVRTIRKYTLSILSCPCRAKIMDALSNKTPSTAGNLWFALSYSLTFISQCSKCDQAAAPRDTMTRTTCKHVRQLQCNEIETLVIWIK